MPQHPVDPSVGPPPPAGSRASGPSRRHRVRWRHTPVRHRGSSRATAAVALGAVLALLGSGLAASSAATRGKARPKAAPCTVSVKLVPSCGKWWGVSPGAFTTTPTAVALRQFERLMGRQATIFHTYHRGDQLFPTAAEAAAAREPGRKRLLLINWKVAYGTTWAAVAAGRVDARIDRLAAHVRNTYPERFFLVVHHEPENEVNQAVGSGMTARDYAAMYRYTVKRLRDRGVTNAVTVMAYMGYWVWGVRPWFAQLYPGDDVVDWIGFDPYNYADPANGHYGDFATLVNRTRQPARFPGFYNWATTKHGNKPLMLSEWGVFEYRADLSRKPWIYSTVAKQLGDYPAIKAFVYFDTPRAPQGDTRINSSPQALAAYRQLGKHPAFGATVP